MNTPPPRQISSWFGDHAKPPVKVGTIEVNSRLSIVHIDKTACQLFGYRDKKAVLGQNLVGLIVPPHAARPVTRLLKGMLRLDIAPALVPNANWNLLATGEERFMVWANERILLRNGDGIGLRCFVRSACCGERLGRRQATTDVLVSADAFTIMSALQTTPRKNLRVINRFFRLAAHPANWCRVLRSIDKLFTSMDDDQLVSFFVAAAEELASREDLRPR